MRLPIRALAVSLTLLLVATAALVQTPSTRAAGNEPRWTSGDFWVYSDSGSSIHTEVVGRENVATLLGNIYDSFHLRESTTSGSVTTTTDLWVRQSDLGVVKTSFTVFGVTSNFTWDPPAAHANFPLFPGKRWSVPLQFSFKIGNGNPVTVSTAFSAEVDAEVDVAVPAGTFRSQSVRENTTGSYTKFYFSEQVGYWAKEERYDNQDQKTGERVLTSYRYQWNTTFLAIIGTVVALIAIAVIAYLWKKRKKAVGLPGGPAPPPP